MPRTLAPGRRSRSRPGLTAAAATLAVLALASCSGGTGASTSAGDGDVVLHVGELGAAPTQEERIASAGQDDGLDYQVDYSLFPSGPAFMEAVPSGAVDLALMADTPAIFAQVGRTPIKVVGVQASTPKDESSVEIVTNPDSGIESVADLEDKKVAVVSATILQYTLVRALEAEGLSYDDITPVELPLTDAGSALATGEVDAVASLDPSLEQLKADGAVTIGDGRGITSGYSYVVATEAALADPDKAEAIGDYLQRLGASLDWSAAHVDEWSTTYAGLTGLPEPVAQAVEERRASGWVPIDQDVIAEQQDQADTYADLGLIAEPIDVSTEYDDRYDDLLTGGGK